VLLGREFGFDRLRLHERLELPPLGYFGREVLYVGDAHPALELESDVDEQNYVEDGPELHPPTQVRTAVDDEHGRERVADEQRGHTVPSQDDLTHHRDGVEKHHLVVRDGIGRCDRIARLRVPDRVGGALPCLHTGDQIKPHDERPKDTNHILDPAAKGILQEPVAPFRPPFSRHVCAPVPVVPDHVSDEK
jgi:hypothetical protein